jgi:hypothetical protein
MFETMTVNINPFRLSVRIGPTFMEMKFLSNVALSPTVPTILKYNKIGKVYSSEYFDVQNVFTPQHGW